MPPKKGGDPSKPPNNNKKPQRNIYDVLSQLPEEEEQAQPQAQTQLPATQSQPSPQPAAQIQLQQQPSRGPAATTSDFQSHSQSSGPRLQPQATSSQSEGQQHPRSAQPVTLPTRPLNTQNRNRPAAADGIAASTTQQPRAGHPVPSAAPSAQGQTARAVDPTFGFRDFRPGEDDDWPALGSSAPPAIRHQDPSADPSDTSESAFASAGADRGGRGRGRVIVPPRATGSRGTSRGGFPGHGDAHGESGPSSRGRGQDSHINDDASHGRGSSRSRGGRGDGALRGGRGRGGSAPGFGADHGGRSQMATDGNADLRDDQGKIRNVEYYPLSTDAKKALEEVDAYANELVKKSDGKQTVEQVKMKQGLRTSFTKVMQNVRIATNYLPMQTPRWLYVYKVDMIRAYDNNNRPIKVKRFADKMLVTEVLRQHPSLHLLRQVPKTWVTDGDLIWSTTALWARNQPAPHLNQINYFNECGVQLMVQDIVITREPDIDCNTSARQLYQNTNRTLFRNSPPAIMMRGLNAFFTEFARYDNRFTFTGGNKGYWKDSAALLTGNIADCISLKGAFLSVRPAMDRLLLNINNAYSPFHPNITVDELLQFTGHRRRQLESVLPGVKVRILYDINGGWGQQGANIRFITAVGADVATEECFASQGHDANGDVYTVHDWFNNPAPNHRNHVLFPSNLDRFNVQQDTTAILIARNSSENPGVEEWYPANLLEILEFQPFHGDLLGEETSSMITRAQLGPAENARRIFNRGFELFGLWQPTQGGLVSFSICRMALLHYNTNKRVSTRTTCKQRPVSLTSRRNDWILQRCITLIQNGQRVSLNLNTRKVE